jgi:hypothetical protein
MEEFQRTQAATTEAMVVARGAREVTDETSAAQAAEILGRVAKVVKAGAKDRLAASQPYRDTTETINQEFKEMLSPLEGAEARLREELSTYEAERAAKEAAAQRKHEEDVRKHEAEVKKATEEAEARRRAQEEAERKAAEAQQPAPSPPPEPEPVAPPPAPPPPPPTARSGVRRTSSGSAIRTKMVWTFEVVDLAMVPHDLKVLDDSAVKRRIAEGAREISGLRIYETPKTRVG